MYKKLKNFYVKTLFKGVIKHMLFLEIFIIKKLNKNAYIYKKIWGIFKYNKIN